MRGSVASLMPSQAWQARRTSTSSGRRGRSPWPSSARRSLAPLLSPHTSSLSRSTRNPALDKQHGQPWASRTENTSPAPAARSLGAGPARRTSTASTAERTSSPRRASLFAPSPSRHLARGQLTLARSSSARSVNITCGPAEDRPMTTGLHTVRDIMCAKCGEVLGWKYGALRPSPPRATSRQRLTPPRSRPQTRRTRPTRSTRRASTSSRRPSSVRRFARSPLAPALTTSTDPSRPLAADVQ